MKFYKYFFFIGLLALSFLSGQLFEKSKESLDPVLVARMVYLSSCVNTIEFALGRNEKMLPQEFALYADCYGKADIISNKIKKIQDNDVMALDEAIAPALLPIIKKEEPVLETFSI